jgi:predicted anti-sigma-YlaC factor YlaD
MQADPHQFIRQLIDHSLAGATSSEEQQTLREHLPTCAHCSEYLEASNRTISALRGFSFEVDPGLDSRVLASLTHRAQQVEDRHLQRSRMWQGGIVALLLTVFGSFAATQLGARVAAAWHLSAVQLHLGLAAFWIAPSLWICLLLLLLPVSPSLWMNKKGLTR